MKSRGNQARIKTGHRISFALLLGLHRFLTGLSLPCARRLARSAADLARALDRSARKEMMHRRLRQVFPEADPCEIRKIVREVYRWLFVSIVDALHFHELVLAGKAEEHLELVNNSGRPLPQGGSGLIFASGHFGWWEVGCMGMGVLGYTGVVIARKMKNPLLEAHISRLRGTHGLRQLPKEGALRRGLKALKKGGSLAVMIDQDARYYGIFVDFLGRPASTYASPAQLSVATGIPVVFSYCMPEGESDRYRIIIRDIIYPQAHADRQAEVHRITQRLTDNLAELVRTHPTRWLWLHRRWKTYPGKYDNKS